ncbi:hypothetical protein H5395_16560 [Paracoccus sp. MC1854]|uniref:hypothetical protein n=1 Tax=Paracoccus sp. MC1854 TaxID=2760306 RepID=UPI001603C6A5|nr:hypothetical protein [Paracoccus sp. MC1854]MBB1493087.1 hypothetical protein [Paracoccus sp. MC1854]
MELTPLCSFFVPMERKHQLGNVAFGGAWSEQIAAREALSAALDVLRCAAARAQAHDPRRDPAVMEALTLACDSHPKGVLLEAAWNRGAALTHPGPRIAELQRVADLLAEAQAGRR